MELSLAGILVCAGLFALGVWLRSPLIGGLFASLPFGSTAIVTLGGQSPLVFVIFALFLLASIALRGGVLQDLAVVLTRIPAALIVCCLTGYAVATAVVFPRIFAGETSAHVVSEGFVVEVPLGPTPGNISQTAYFMLGALVFLAFCILLRQMNHWREVERGFFTFAAVHAGLGLVDVAAKLAGLGDVLEPIRSASYAFLVEVAELGFWRIVGAFPEASAFAAYTLPCLAFTFVYWRNTGSGYAFALSLVLFVLLVFSTSTTGYAALAIVAVLLLFSLGLAALQGLLKGRDFLFFGLVWLGLAVGLSAYLYDEHLFDPFVTMIDTMVFDKVGTASGLRRAYWNAKAMDGFFDTHGLGIGMGSSRASSWAVAMLSQLGIIGTLMFGLLMVELIRPLCVAASPAERKLVALGRSARAATIAWLVAISISGGTADPGLPFFLGLATVVCCRERVARATSPLQSFRRAH